MRVMVDSGGGAQHDWKEKMSGLMMATSRVRTAIVALPIAIVTSWVLYGRLVKGEERKSVPSQG